MKRRGRVSMEKHSHVLEMQRNGFGVRAISKSLRMCKKTVRKYLLLPVSGGSSDCGKPKNFPNLEPKEPCSLSFRERVSVASQNSPEWLRELDLEHLVSELSKGVSYKTLYREMNVTACKYWSFWQTTKALLDGVNPKIPRVSLRLNHNPGEKTFVDYTDGLNIIDPKTGEMRKTQLFVGTLPFSSFVFAEFTLGQNQESFIGSHERMWYYFGGVTKYTTPDNLKSAVNKAHIYDPDVNKTFCDYANYAGFAVLPARPRTPKDKANVETHCGLLQRTFYEEVRNRTFSSLEELNVTLKLFLEKLNNTVMKDHGVSRWERFQKELHLLLPLPKEFFEVPIVKDAKVHPDCHIQFLKNQYSVPYTYVGKEVRVVKRKSLVEIYCKITCETIAVHSLPHGQYKTKTNELHYPPEQNNCKNFSIEVALRDGAKIGSHTRDYFMERFSGKFPLQYLRCAQGIVRLARSGKYTMQAMEYASKQMLNHNRVRMREYESYAKYFCNGVPLIEPVKTPRRNYKECFLQSDLGQSEELTPQ
jgi:hypothetical protein